MKTIIVQVKTLMGNEGWATQVPDILSLPKRGAEKLLQDLHAKG